MKIKEFVFVILVSFLLFLAVAKIASSQITTCDDNQRIFKLNWESNSHAAAWDQSAYSVEICYDDYFTQSSQETGSAAHTCATGNKLLSLSQAVNAHTSFAGGTGYPVDVCHAGLKDCTLELNTANACGTDKAAIVFLSNDVNAHTSRLYSSLYKYVICCDGNYGIPIGTTPEPAPETEEFEYVCADYEDELNCMDDDEGAAQNDPGCPAGKNDSCYCTWKSNKCILEYNITTPAGCGFTCSKSMEDYEDVECVNDMKEVGIIATRTPSSCEDTEGICLDSTVSVPCGFEFAELPFFGIWQFIIASLGVAFIYFVTRKIKRG